MSEFWSGWITVLTIVTLVLLFWILFATRRMKSPTEDNNTGHEFDGIVEEDNPLPQWWLIMFVVTLIFGIGYLVVYPGMGNYAGALGWTSAKQHDAEAEVIAARFAKAAGEFSALSFEELMLDENANKAGGRLYANNCSVCHGGNAGGAIGFPNLSNASWQWGGSADKVVHSIAYGRRAAMPAWSAVMDDRQIDILADYIAVEAQREFSSAAEKAKASKSEISRQGKQLYATYCVACHGRKMEGNPMLGAPSLVDDEWVYGASLESVKESIVSGRNGVMPAHQDLLSKEKIRLIAAYVLSLSAD